MKAVNLCDEAREELQLQKGLCHPNVCRVLDSIASRSKMYIALELCDAGDLRVFMQETSVFPLDIEDMRCFLGDLLDAVSYMHSFGLVHRDIKPANMLLKGELSEPRPRLKLADFGFSACCAQGGSLNAAGTVAYMSPEQLLGSCNESCDMWACGVVFAEMIMGEILVPRPCWDDSARALRHLRRGGFSMKVDVAAQLVMHEQGAAHVLQQMFMFEWSRRLDAKDALHSPFSRAGVHVLVSQLMWLVMWVVLFASRLRRLCQSLGYRVGRRSMLHGLSVAPRRVVVVATLLTSRPALVHCGKCTGVRSSSVFGSSILRLGWECMRFRGS